MDIQKVNVTPRLASIWLESKNGSNRSVSPKTVAKYARDMKSGNWVDTHQNAIGFYEDGDLADGQHRLAAIVESGVSVDMFVAEGIKREHAGAIDQGRSRSVSDGLRISGMITSGKYISAQVSLAKLLRGVETGSDSIASLVEIADIISKAQDAFEFVLDEFSKAPPGIGTASVRAALVTAYKNLPESTVSHIARVLVSGMPEHQGDAVLIRLRNWLMINRSTSQKERNVNYTTCVRVFHAYANGDDLGVIRRTSTIYMESGIFDGK